MTIAKQRGFPVTIYRPSIITGQTNTGIFNTNAYLENLIKGCIQIKCAPDLNTLVDMVPVDYVSKSVAYLSLQSESSLKFFHITNPNPLHMNELLDWIETFGYPLLRLPHKEWKTKLFNAQDFRDNALYPFAGFLAELEEHQTIIPQHDCQNTLQGLADTSIECPPVNDKLLYTYFTHFIRNEFVNVPQENTE